MNGKSQLTHAELIGRLLGDEASPDQARAILDRAEWLDVDVIDVLAAHFPNDPEYPYRRAAQLLGVAYSHDISSNVAPLGQVTEIDRLSGLRSLRGKMEGKEVLFVSPRFGQLALLYRHLGAEPSIGRKICIASPATLRSALVGSNGGILFESAIQRLARRFPLTSAHLDLSMAVRAGFVAAVMVAIIASVVPMPVVQPAILGLVSLMLVTPSIFRIWAAATYRKNTTLRPDVELGDDQLPLYSVLIPLRDEAHMVPQIARAMRRLDYPAEKLEIVFVVESASPQTVLAARRQLNDSRFSLVIVPRRPPYTKPKALNFALPLVRGAHVVVFDAEDVPDPGQLRRSASLFAQDASLQCLQAELLIAPSSRGFFAKMFAAEYAGHFGVLLPAISRARFPMPLGGTSNHFRTGTLREIGAWDAFNVTEDADLGIRMARLGLKVETFASVTWEEAPETALAWVRQRSRWMKGWMQTLLVHSRRSRRLLDDLSWRNLGAFYIFVGGMVISTAIHALFLVSTLMLLGIQIVVAGVPAASTLANGLTLLLGYSGAAAITVIGLERLERRGWAMAIAGLPLYWIFGWCALVLALYDLLVRPYHWEKTSHKGFPSGSPLSPDNGVGQGGMASNAPARYPASPQ